MLGFIHTKEGKRIGLRLFDTITKKVSEVSFPKDGAFFNLNISKGRLYPKHCKVSDFPVITSVGDTLGACLPGDNWCKCMGTWKIR